MKLSSKYWLIQALGWGAYSAVTFFLAVRVAGLRLDIVIGFSLFSFTALHSQICCGGRSSGAIGSMNFRSP
jgi:hypothetical protein